MIYRNKITGNTVKANGYAEEFAFSHNSNYELVTKEEIKTTKPKSEKPKSEKPKTDKPKVSSQKTTKPKEENKDAKLKTGDDVIKELLKDRVE